MSRKKEQLQFGHGVAAVDDASNGTTIVFAHGLHFGHGVAAGEDGRSTGSSAAACRRFNSATALPPWMTPGTRSRPPSRTPCFNSATALPPWMTGEDDVDLKRKAEASIRPRRCRRG